MGPSSVQSERGHAGSQAGSVLERAKSRLHKQKRALSGWGPNPSGGGVNDEFERGGSEAVTRSGVGGDVRAAFEGVCWVGG